MPPRSDKLLQLLREVSGSGQKDGESLVGEHLNEAGLLDRAKLNDELGKILEGATGNPPLARIMGLHLEAFEDFVRQGDVAGSANEVCEMLSLEDNDLRRAALLSLMIRLAGKRKFDPVAAYILENRAARGTGRS